MIDLLLQSRPVLPLKKPFLYAAIACFAITAWLDAITPLGVSVWLFYLLPIWLLSRVTPFDARLVVGGAALATLLTSLTFLSSPGPYAWRTALNRGIGLALFWMISLLLVRARRHQVFLADSEAEFRANFELAAVGQAELNAETGRFTRVNDRLCEITGYASEDLLMMQPQDLTHPDDRNAGERTIARVLRGDTEEYHGEERYLRKDGSSRWVRVSARLIRDSAGRPGRTIAVIEDVTERKEAETALLRLTMELERRVAERTKALTDSERRLRALTAELNLAEQSERRRLAGDLHDYLAQLLVVGRMKLGQALQLVESPEGKQHIDEADDVLNRSLNYTRSLVAQLVPPALEQFGLSAALSWLGEEMRRHQLLVRVEVPPERPPLSIEQAGLLFQSVRELLMNVVKHAKTERALVRLEHDCDRLTITVQDQGTGFEQTPEIESAVDKFGLFSIRERMYSLGGSFAIESTPELGTTARLTLPFTKPFRSHVSGPATEHRIHRRDSSVEAQPSAAYPEHKNLIRVLLVDDHAMVREGLRTLLNGYPGIDVVGEAGNGEEAIDQAKKLLPQVIVMDVNMPKMDGIEATKRITQTLPGSVVIGLSVNVSSQVKEAMKAAGALTLLTKESAAKSLYYTIVNAQLGPVRLLDPQESLPFAE